MSPKLKKIALKVLLPLLFWVGLWTIAAHLVGKPLLLPSPMLTLQTLVQQAAKPSFWQSTGQTLLRILGSYFIGVLLGAVFAFLTFFSELCSALLSPLMRLLRATPVASFILLLFLWVKTNYVPVVAAAIIVVPIIWANLVKALEQADSQLLELAGAYHFSFGKTLKLIYLPATLPYFASAAKISIGLAWKAGVAAEVLCIPKFAIGSEIYRSKLYLETPVLFAWTAVVILLSFLLEKAIQMLVSRWEVSS